MRASERLVVAAAAISPRMMIATAIVTVMAIAKISPQRRRRARAFENPTDRRRDEDGSAAKPAPSPTHSPFSP